MLNTPPINALLTHAEICAALGARVRLRRTQLKLSRQKLSDRSGVSVPTISRLELKGVTSLSIIVKLSQALGAVETLDGLFATSKYNSMKEFLEWES